jgi:hypothetical protein
MRQTCRPPRPAFTVRLEPKTAFSINGTKASASSVTAAVAAGVDPPCKQLVRVPGSIIFLSYNNHTDFNYAEVNTIVLRTQGRSKWLLAENLR